MYNPSSHAGYIGRSPPFSVVRLRRLPFDYTEGLDIVDVLLIHKGEKQARYGPWMYKRHEYYEAIAHGVSDAHSGSPHRGARAKSHDEGKDLLEHTGILRLRGLPYSARKEDIKDFFKDFVLADDVIRITYTSVGRLSCEAFVEFANADDSRAAMVKDKMTLGSRYIELFPATQEEMDEAIAKGRPNFDDNQSEPVKRTGTLRHLPYSVTKEDILEFFSGFFLSEDSIHITFTLGGRPTDEAFV
ncbi:hypothetical protein Cgig2_002271 [Carnegiea gigantea]|uniref:RRM domain-containing protein n=1 Tax=Carnegiea gigantea TaxID=171969 RepID=A0A9Q1QPL4_9CARY|nr:hypothetical protein Cgig2_002271 [Carnegiea gigantea]